jgi:hypothetical protein
MPIPKELMDVIAQLAEELGLVEEEIEISLTRDEAIAIAKDVMPDCWEITPEGDRMIHMRHGHREPCINKNEYNETMGMDRFMQNLVTIFPPDEIVRRLEAIRGQRPVATDPPMPF